MANVVINTIRSDLQGKQRWSSGTVYEWNRLMKGYIREYTKCGSNVFQSWSKTDSWVFYLYLEFADGMKKTGTFWF